MHTWASYTNPSSRIRYREGSARRIVKLLNKSQSAAALEAFFLAMTLNQDVCKKAQREIDEQIGGDRLIEHRDRENLPYITCLVKEVLRYVYPAIDLTRTYPLFGQMGCPCTVG